MIRCSVTLGGLIQARNEHEALRAGTWRAIEADDRRICASLRHGDGDVVLVLVNLGGDSISDYALSLDEGPLGAGAASEILKGVSIEQPTLNAAGGFSGYRPLDEPAPCSTDLIQLE